MRTITLVALLAAGFLRAQSNPDLTEYLAGDQSADHGLTLLKRGDQEHKIHTKEAAGKTADYYSRAVRLLPNRPEAANAFLYLGITALVEVKQ